MKAIGFRTSLPITEPDSFIEFEKEIPTATGRDLLVKIEAIAVNPVDYKVRGNSLKDRVQDQPKVIGWDAVGTVEAVGHDVTFFKKGDKVYYAGDITREGCNQEYQLVDERIAGHAPQKTSMEEAAAIPLTALTAWELFFNRMQLSPERDQGKSILIIGGAGGVGSIAIQIAKKVLGLQVIATASRPASVEWCRTMGADHVVNHKSLVEEVRKAGFETVDFIADFVDINQYWSSFVELIKPQGRIGSISDPVQPVDLRLLKGKSVSFHWELMFTRATFKTDDMQEQHTILNRLAELLDNGTLKTTLQKTYTGFTADHLKAAHELQESGEAIGKTVIRFD